MIDIFSIFLPHTILGFLMIGWTVISSGFKKPQGNINRGYKIQEKPIKTAHLQYLIGLEDGFIQPPPTVEFFNVREPGFIIKKYNQILIYGGDSTIIRGGRFATPVGYINLEQPNPMLEIRLWIPAKWLIGILVAKLFLIDVMSIVPSVIFTIFFAVGGTFFFFIETSELESFLDKQAKTQQKSEKQQVDSFLTQPSVVQQKSEKQQVDQFLDQLMEEQRKNAKKP